MARRQERSNAVRKLAAVIMVGTLTAVIVLAAGEFLRFFDSTARVTLVAPRAGLVMNSDAKVTLRGVQVGRVVSLDSRDGHAVLALDIDNDQLEHIPANVNAQIKSNTVFGAKAVQLTVPTTGASGTMHNGQVIKGDHVQVELNTVFQQLVDVLADLQPDKTSTVIGAVDAALSGRGDQTGEALERMSGILAKATTRSRLAQLRELITQAGPATGVYADSMPDLMRTVDNATVIGNTLVDHQQNLDALLINATGMANTIDGVVAPSKARLISTLSNASPVAGLLGYQAPGLKCFINAMAATTKTGLPIFGNPSGLKLWAGLLPGSEPYQYPENLPKVNVDGPPTCEAGLGDPNSKEHPNFYVGDNAPVPYQPRTKPKFDRTKVFQLLFGEPSRG